MVSVTTLSNPDRACTVCGSDSVVPVIALRQVPIHCNIHWPSREAALAAPRGDLELGFCPACSHLFNGAFDPALMAYSEAYDNSLHYSGRFSEYAEGLARRLIETHDLQGKAIVEIGCGKGDFLALLCELGDNRGVGFDVSHQPERLPGASDRITFVQDYFQEKYADLACDLIVCRHVLEHIQHPVPFLATIRRVLGDRTGATVYVEVPNALFTLRDLGVWDLIYEHCSYFTPASLRSAFRRAGFRVRDEGVAFDGQFLWIEAVPDPKGIHSEEPSRPDDREELLQLKQNVAAFRENYLRLLGEWQARLQKDHRQGKRTVLWGAGSKGVAFLNALNLRDTIGCIVDINPHKQGRHVAGTGQLIVAPESLADCRPDTIVVMNPIYRTEILRRLQALDISADFVCA